MSGKHAKSYDDEVPKALRREQNYDGTTTRNTRKNENYGNNAKRKKNKRKGLSIFAKIVIVLLVILMAILGAGYWYIQDKLGKIQKVELNKEELGISASAEESLSGYRNIALFGVDSRSDNLEKGNRSDCIIIASLNNKTKEVKLISVYRDTYVQIQGHSLDKITHAYSYGSAQLALNTLNTNLDLNIKEFVTVNFDSVAEAVDELGGVTIKVETQEELRYLNSYIEETARVTGKSNAKVASTGKQTLNGVQAVAYSRIRYTSGGDYKRTERMRTVIEAMLNKLKTKSIGEINNFANKILPLVYTNISTGDIVSLAPSLMSMKITESIGWPYETKGITLDRWYGVPVTLEENVTKLHQEAFGETDYVPSETVKNISSQIVKKTGYK